MKENLTSEAHEKQNAEPAQIKITKKKFSHKRETYSHTKIHPHLFPFLSPRRVLLHTMERRSSNGSKRASSQSGGGGKSRMSSIVSSSRGATLCFASALEAAKRLYLPLFVVQAVIQLLSQLLLHALTNTLSHFSAWFSLIVGTLLLLNVAFLYYSVCVKNQLDAADALQRMPPAWRHLWSTTITLIVVYSLLFILNSVLTITVTFGKEVGALLLALFF